MQPFSEKRGTRWILSPGVDLQIETWEGSWSLALRGRTFTFLLTPGGCRPDPEIGL